MLELKGTYLNVICPCSKIQIVKVVLHANNPYRWKLHPVSLPVYEHMVGSHLLLEVIR